MSLSLEDFGRIVSAAMSVVEKRGQDYYGWVNPPVVQYNGTITHTSGWGDKEKTVKISGAKALEIMTKKIDGAYGERFICSLGTVAALIANDYNVRFVQFRSEHGVPFDDEGWVVIIVETMPIFHISPKDLRLNNLADIVEILDDNQAPDVCWKQTNKVGEFAALMAGAIKPGLDLVEIAKSKSKN